jgi:diguanylate cyclase (GGDEF)-like protein
MVDVDHFKKFNDTHGHQAGDAVLKSVARTVADTVGSAGFVARYGGEEFSIILAGPEGTLRNAAKAAERVRAAIESGTVEHDGKTLKVTASFGLALASEPGAAESPTRLIEQADKRL